MGNAIKRLRERLFRKSRERKASMAILMARFGKKPEQHKETNAFQARLDRMMSSRKAHIIRIPVLSTRSLVLRAKRRIDFESAKKCILRGANPDTKDNFGMTLLMYASSAGDLEMCRFLLQHGADANAQDDYRWTALIMAAANGQKDACTLLIENGADAFLRAKDGKNAFAYARDKGQVSTMILMYGKLMDKIISNQESLDFAANFFHCIN
ncbi:MAG: ankyrin repeat domain-containing protein [Candidatus Micrarchaeota archaeon]|nr:ankyrin repeat domain-containing protein [Candidatus Micrarchaeota archaeon]